MMDSYLILLNIILFLYEIALIFTNSLFIFYSHTPKSIKIINIISILLFITEIFILNIYVVFVIHVINIPLICHIFCIIPDNVTNSDINIYNQNDNYINIESHGEV